MPTIHEVHMGAGLTSVPFRRDTALEDLLRANDHAHLEFWWGERLVACGPFFTFSPDGGLFHVSGALLPWWLGVEADGPLIGLQRYCAATNKLSNGNFELGDLYWRRAAQNSKWVIGTAEEISGAIGAYTNVDFQDDDVLQSDERFEVFNGDAFRAQASFYHPDGGDGSARIRIICSGRFKHPNLNDDPGFDDTDKWELGDATDIEIVADAGEAYSGTGVLRIGPLTKEQQLTNGTFEDAFNFWDDFNEVESSSERAHRGSLSAKFKDGGSDTAALQQDMTGAIVPGDEFEGAMSLSSGDADVPMVMRVTYPTADGSEVAEVIHQVPFPEAGWRRFTGRFTLFDWDPDLGDPTLIVAADQIIAEGGAWWADDVTVKRVRGNVQAISTKNRGAGGDQDNWKIVPKRTYRITAKIRSEVGVKNGEIWFQARFSKTALGADEHAESPHITPTDGKWTKFEWEVASESGYDHMGLAIFGMDVYGGSFWVDKVDIVYADETEYVVDQEILAADATASPVTATIDDTPPDGAEDIRLEIIAENDGAGWRVDNAVLRRLCTATAAADIVADFLDGTGLSAGDINSAGNILFDWVIRNRTNRQALDELSRTGLVQPAREWKVNPDGTLDWGLESEICADRTDVILREHDIYLIDPPAAEETTEDFATTVKVIGAERERFRGGGKRYTIKATAANANPGYELYDGSDFARTHLIEDGSIDHADHAAALATLTAEELAGQRLSYDLRVSDWKTLGTFDLGDWIYLHHPSAGISDPDVSVLVDGEHLHPVRLRCLERQWTLGSGPWRIKLRTGPGSTIDVSDFVEWPAATEAQITLGTIPPEFVTNPQGGGVARQWVRYRKALGEA